MRTFLKFSSIVALLFAAALLGAPTMHASAHNTASNHSTAHFASAPGDEFWDDQFGVPNVAGTVTAIVTNGDEVYVGGNFTYADGFVVNNIALWDGTQTHALGTGLSGCHLPPCTLQVFALAVQGSNLFVGGNFASASGVPVNGLAMWNGAQWSDVGGGVNGVVYAIALNGGDVYVGGVFDKAGNVNANNIARWDGSQWHALASGINGVSVNTLAIQNNDLYVGGEFSGAGNVAATNVARWDGTTWHSMGGGLSGNRVLTLAFHDGILYAGGEFISGCLAEWDGTNWSVSNDLCPQMPIPTEFAWIQSLVEWNGKLHALVRSSYADFAIVAWLENGDWKIGPSLTYNAMWTLGTGNFVYVGGNGIHAWDDQNWYALFNANAQGLDGGANALATDGNSIYVGGFFTYAGNLKVNNIARWDGASWNALGDGLDGGVSALAMHNGELYVGGSFTHAGNLEVNYLARWNGSQWSDIGGGMSGPVYALAFDGNQLIVGGNFRAAGGTRANNIAKWDGAAWSAFGRGTNGMVRALAVSKGNLYAGGMFDRAGNVFTKNIARYDGHQWFALGQGVSDFVSTLVTDGKKIYVGGGFKKAGTRDLKYLARWNGKRWSGLGKGVDFYAQALALRDGTLFAGGNFEQAGQVTAHGVAKWDGSRWSALGAGTNGVYALAHSGNDVVAAGSFQTTGDKSAGNFGIWHDPSPPRVTLLTPPNAQTVPKQKVKLDWSDASGTTDYALEIRKDANKQTIVKTTTTVSAFRTPALERGVKYSWRVQACANIGGENYCSAWTAWRNFTVQEK